MQEKDLLEKLPKLLPLSFCPQKISMLKKIILTLLSISVIINPSYSFADEITVSGNGEGSTNNVAVSSDTTSQTQQSNSAEVNNNIDINANTGGNTANENSGETNIATGDISATSEITNEAVNQNNVEAGCCGDNLALNISGNGSDSYNSIDYSSNSTTNVSISNSANIENRVQGHANTGNNSANQNSGEVSIETGNIYASDTIKNKSINVYGIEALNGNSGSVYISIDGNGADSDSSIKFSNDNNINIDIKNSANIVNDSYWDLNTGGNEANQNSGDVKIATGDIYFTSAIENGPINYGWVDVDCCDQDEDEGGNPPDGTPPPTPGQPSNPSSSSSSSNPSSGGTTAGGQVLPVTGSPSLFFLLIANVVMFFLGWYLRLRSGRSPNYLFAR